MKKRMLPILLSTLALLLVLVTNPAMAAEDEHTMLASGSCGDAVTYVLYDDGELIISGSGPMEDYGAEKLLGIQAIGTK